MNLRNLEWYAWHGKRKLRLAVRANKRALIVAATLSLLLAYGHYIGYVKW